MYQTTYLKTPIGFFRITGSELGIRRIQLDTSLSEYPTESEAIPEDHLVMECRRQMDAYFGGKLQQFDLKLDWSGTPDFNRLVWRALVEIPYGKTAAYSEIAERIGHPTAVRAVGMANRNNPVAIVVPCHRVIGKAGELRGYFYGLDTKMLLLRHENPVRFAEQGQLFE
jgi:methylated-DNA-[protein]-cysteine S-methyltransferase